MHQSNDLRDALLDKIDASVHAGWRAFAGCGDLVEQLHTCSDVMPRQACEAIDLPSGSTFAQAIQRLKLELARRAVAL